MFEFRCNVEVKRSGKTVQCGIARIIPSGSNAPRCPVHEPERLWLEAETAYKKRG